MNDADYRPLKVRLLSDPDGPIKPQRDGAPSKKGFGGAVFVGNWPDLTETAAPEKVRLPMDYAREHHWVEVVDQKPVNYPGGPAQDPWRVTHTVFEASKVVLHMRDGDVEYSVVRQPGKYDAAGKPVATSGDTSHVVHWDFLLEKVS